MKLLEGKTGLITGGARGIGRAIAIAFAQQGANVAFTDMNADDNFKSLEVEFTKFGQLNLQTFKIIIGIHIGESHISSLLSKGNGYGTANTACTAGY